MEIVVAKKFRLIEQEKGKFVISEHRKIMRNSIKIEKSELEAYNKIAPISGIYYEIDEKATKERLEIIESKNAPKLDRNALKLEADSMGLEYKKNIKTDALQALIEENK